jgi:hypothetical protein
MRFGFSAPGHGLTRTGDAGLGIAALILLATPAFAENLVANPSFEDFHDCPTDVSQPYRLHFWHNPKPSTSDMHNVCNTGRVGVPDNAVGTQSAHHGFGYGGFIAGLPEDEFVAWSEYLQVPLLDTLVAGETYTLSFYVSLADGAGYAVDEIGAAVLPDAVYAPNEFGSLVNNAPFLSPTVVHGGGVISDTANWTLITGSFVANGDERFLIIGNFGGTNQIPVAVTPEAGYEDEVGFHPYYFVDSVSLVRSGCAVIDFDTLAVSGSGSAFFPPPHLEDGYEVDNLAVPDFLVFGDEHPNYPGSGAVSADTLDFEVSVQGGGTFDLCSLRFSDIHPILSSARLLGPGGAVDFPLSAEPPAMQTVYPTGFTSLSSFRIQGLVQFPFIVDDIAVCEVGKCSGASSDLAHGRYAVEGASTGVGFTWRLAPQATVVNVPSPVTPPLQIAFADSIDTSNPPGATAWVSGYTDWIGVMHAPGFSLLVGPENGTPSCTVDLNAAGCTFNPTVFDVRELPDPPTSPMLGPPVPVPSGRWRGAALAVVVGGAGVFGSIVVRNRKRSRPAV